LETKWANDILAISKRRSLFHFLFVSKENQNQDQQKTPQKGKTESNQLLIKLTNWDTFLATNIIPHCESKFRLFIR
jgi:hypothetical protein